MLMQIIILILTSRIRFEWWWNATVLSLGVTFVFFLFFFSLSSSFLSFFAFFAFTDSTFILAQSDCYCCLLGNNRRTKHKNNNTYNWSVLEFSTNRLRWNLSRSAQWLTASEPRNVHVIIPEFDQFLILIIIQRFFYSEKKKRFERDCNWS